MRKAVPYNAVNVLNVAVAYARYSSTNQREESIDAQLRAIREHCERNGILLLQVYQDEAISGKNDDRENFQQMISDIMRGYVKVDTVLVHKFNRFARNKFDSAIYKKRLKDIGVKVVSVTQPIDDSPEGALMEAVIEAMDEYYSANLALEVKKGLKENALKGKHAGGVLAFGFSVDAEGKYMPNENAPIVKRIFEEYAAEIPKTEICERLNREGLRNQRGNTFNVRTLYDMLRNEKYIGHYIYNLGNETIRLENIIEPIIDLDLWHKVQRICNQPVKARMRHQKQRYLLTGKTFCAHCDMQICGDGSKRSRNGELLYYYKCVGKSKHRNGCKNLSLNKAWFEENVLKIVTQAVMTEKQVQLIADIAYSELKESRKAPAVSVPTLKRELTSILVKQEKLTELYLDGMVDKSILDKKNAHLLNRKHEIQIEIEKQKSAAASEALSKEDLAVYVQEYIERIKNGYPAEEDYMRAVFNAFVEKIIVSDSAVTVYVKADFSFNGDGANRKSAGGFLRLSPIKFQASFVRKRKVFGRNEHRYDLNYNIVLSN